MTYILFALIALAYVYGRKRKMNEYESHIVNLERNLKMWRDVAEKREATNSPGIKWDKE